MTRPATDSPHRIDATHLAELFRIAAERFGPLPAFATRLGRERYHPTAYDSLYNRGLAVATALIDAGFAPGAHAALLADNRVEWMIADVGILLAGGADVPRGTDVTDGDIRHILAHSGATFVFVETPALLARVLALRAYFPLAQRFVVLAPEDATLPDGVAPFSALIARGEALRAAGDRRAEARAAGIRPADTATLIYTSGTTGVPKGVRLTHANLVSQVRNLPIPLETTDRVLSILPVWHSYERTFELLCLSQGACTYYTNVRTIAEDLRAVCPTYMASAPRVWESLHQRILNGVRTAHPIRRGLFHAAWFCARHFQTSVFFLRGRTLATARRPPVLSAVLGAGHAARLVLLAAPYVMLNAVVLEKLRLVVGGCFRGTISGGGALPRDVDEFFNYIGIPVLEGYGLTETSPVLAVRTWENFVIGTVGPAFPETRIRITDLATGTVLYPDPTDPDLGRGRRGEIEARGPQVMDGYYREPEQTAHVFRDGWFRTGDIGRMTFNDCLQFLGRCKETIVLLSGENVEPGPIEARLQESPSIQTAMVVGQDAHRIGALLVPAYDYLRLQPDFAGLDDAAILGHPGLAHHLAAEAKRLINREAGFKAFELVSGVRVLPKALETGDELTSTFKLKRHVIAAKYPALIAAATGSRHD